MYHPLEYKARRQKTSRSADPKSSDTIEASPSTPTKPQAIFDWWHSARSGHISTLESMLTMGFDMNSQASDRNTALHCAAHGSQLAAVESLLHKGASLNLLNNRDETALFEAAVGGSSECISRLLDAKATISHFCQHYSATRLCFADHVIRIGDISLVETAIRADSLTR
ncbi:ankyrin [Didymella exigua CBS 183.55]|uniref:Ankyrin n=1 Tax=Didymella exigua CBS 183.55 TaxID=1150837 RepID=A0A6A5RCA6_9PLEO|nr:ankyrin [Didymella exigua CBS 183.55]KAF1924920.1 ankyrin [Didymella exigua CBS 183.55]